MRSLRPYSLYQIDENSFLVPQLHHGSLSHCAQMRATGMFVTMHCTEDYLSQTTFRRVTVDVIATSRSQ
jgi:hypothetical protein